MQAVGTLAALNLPRVEFEMLSGTKLLASGRLTNVTDPDHLGIDMTILHVFKAECMSDKFIDV